MIPVHRLMQKAVQKRVFPGGVLLAAKQGKICFFEAYGFANLFSRLKMTRNTIFDLASLTKPLATALAVMELIKKSQLSLEQKLETILPDTIDTDKGLIKIKHLLVHNSGFPAYRPYYINLMNFSFDKRKPVLRRMLINEPLHSSVGSKVVYSDLGFMMLEWIIEKISGQRMDFFLADSVYNPLGLNNLFFIDILKPCKGYFAATQLCPWRNILLNGLVHDDNAYAVGGIQGHAGLFGTAYDIFLLLSELLNTFYQNNSTSVFQQDIVNIFFKPYENTGRCFGFDKPDLYNSSSGTLFSKNSIGHLGFTGTSFWVDIDRCIIVILLTNRVHPSRDNFEIKIFRPKVHDAVMQEITNK